MAAAADAERAVGRDLQALARRSGEAEAQSRERARSASTESKNDIVRQLFHLPSRVRVISDYSCAIDRKVLFHGRMFVTDSCVCFYSNLFGFEKKIILPYRKLVRITKEKTALVIPNAIALNTERKEYVFRSFWGRYRDECYDLIRQAHRKCVGLPPDEEGLDGDTPPPARREAQREPEPEPAAPAEADDTESVMGDEDEDDPAAALEAVTDGSPLKHHCLSTTLGVSMQGFFDAFVADGAPCSMRRFHRRRGDRAVEVSPWAEQEQFGMTRNVDFVAPVDAPIGPKETRAHKTQRYKFYGDAGLVVESSSRMEDIPYGDYFTVEERWVVRPGPGESECRISWSFEVRFTKSTMLRGTIESGTNTSIEKGAENWMEMAGQFLAGTLPAEGDDGDGDAPPGAGGDALGDHEDVQPPGRMVWIMLNAGRFVAGLVWFGHLATGIAQMFVPLLLAYAVFGSGLVLPSAGDAEGVYVGVGDVASLIERAHERDQTLAAMQAQLDEIQGMLSSCLSSDLSGSGAGSGAGDGWDDSASGSVDGADL